MMPAASCAGIVMRHCVLLLLTSLLIGSARLAAAAEPVDLALALVADVSRSIDDKEFVLQKEGYVAAFTDPNVLAAIRGGAIGAIAVCYIEFAGNGQVRKVLDWSLIRDAASAQDFAGRIAEAPRSAYGFTAISAGIDRAVSSFEESGFAAGKRVIDVSGDGTNNSGRSVTQSRDAALALGITINGLTIINDHPQSYIFAHVQPPGGLTNWYRENVIGGPGAFVLEVHDFHSFGEAMTRKLITEIALAAW
jgi:hypothetical protein